MFAESLSASRWARRAPQSARSHTPTSSARSGVEYPSASAPPASQQSSANPRLLSSASAAPVDALTGPTAPRENDLAKLSRLLARLQWKADHLLVSLENSHLFSASATTWPAPDPANAEASSSAQQTHARHPALQSSISGAAMFKLDFYEYYNLLERALVGFLAYYRVPLTSAALQDDDAVAGESRATGAIIGAHVLASAPARGPPPSAASGVPGQSNHTGSSASGTAKSAADGAGPQPQAHAEAEAEAQGGAGDAAQQAAQPHDARSRFQRVFGAASHRYHANVLDAFSLAANPLRDVLGADTDAGAQLRRAKDLRNRWKEVEALPADVLDGAAGTGPSAGSGGTAGGAAGTTRSGTQTPAAGQAAPSNAAVSAALTGHAAATAAAAPRVQPFFADADELRALLQTILSALETALQKARADAAALSARDDTGAESRAQHQQQQQQQQQQILVTRTGAGTGAGAGAGTGTRTGVGGADEDIVMEDAPWEAVADAMAWEYM